MKTSLMLWRKLRTKLHALPKNIYRKTVNYYSWKMNQRFQNHYRAIKYRQDIPFKINYKLDVAVMKLFSLKYIESRSYTPVKVILNNEIDKDSVKRRTRLLESLKTLLYDAM